MEPSHELQGDPRGSNFNSKVKEMVLTLISQLSVLPEWRDMHKPGFVYLLEGVPKEESNCTPHFLLA